MNILAGRYKGLRIKTLPTVLYRPTQSRVRKSLFDMLGNLEGTSVLDLFAGSGILGFEAASRGAYDVTFVDNSEPVVRLLRQNQTQFKVTRFRILKIDSNVFLKSCKLFDLILADPPYRQAGIYLGVKGNSLVDLCLAKVKLGGRFVLEIPSDNDWIVGDREKIYGDTKLILWHKT